MKLGVNKCFIADTYLPIFQTLVFKHEIENSMSSIIRSENVQRRIEAKWDEQNDCANSLIFKFVSNKGGNSQSWFLIEIFDCYQFLDATASLDLGYICIYKVLCLSFLPSFQGHKL